MTHEHSFQLLIALIAIVPTGILSYWALRNQLAQTKARLDVVLSLKPLKTPSGEINLNQCPDVLVRNLSPFPLRICEIGYRIEKYYSVGIPLVVLRDGPRLSEIPWPYEIEPRAQSIFSVNHDRSDGLDTFAAIIAAAKAKGKPVAEVVRAYVLTECNERFVSKRIPRKSWRT